MPTKSTVTSQYHSFVKVFDTGLTGFPECRDLQVNLAGRPSDNDFPECRDLQFNLAGQIAALLGLNPENERI